MMPFQHTPVPMSDNSREDILIAGGGLSGLLLGYFLKKHRPDVSFRILEKKTTYKHDRHWSFWIDRKKQFEFDFLIEKTYEKFSAAGRLIASRAHSYAVIASGRFYDHMMKNLSAHIDFSCDVTHAAADHVICNGEKRTAPHVFTSIPYGVTLKRGLWQNFYGWRVVTENPVFDPRQAVIMDLFSQQPSGAMGFYYVLPFSAYEALVEPTVFSVDGGEEKAFFDAAYRHYMAALNPGRIDVLEEESGCLPMARVACAPNGSENGSETGPPPDFIGAAGGWLRPSTGYSFLTAVRMAETIAQDAQLRPPKPYGRSLLAMDQVFLDVARADPGVLPEVFSGWFAGAEPERLIRFLQSRQLPLRDGLNVVQHTPYKAAFLKAALQNMGE